MHAVSISGSGVFTPEETISNAELVTAFNAYADRQNALHADEIARGEREPVPHSNEGFIVKASGIESRYVLDKKGTLDPEIMHPVLRERSDEELSVMAEMALKAAAQALEQAGRTPISTRSFARRRTTSAPIRPLQSRSSRRSASRASPST